MAAHFIRLNGFYSDLEKITIEGCGEILFDLGGINPLEGIPYGTKISLRVQVEDPGFRIGIIPVAWATFDRNQAETIQAALLAQNITVKIDYRDLHLQPVLLLTTSDDNDFERAADYIWRDDNGLRLKPDWYFGAGARNDSFHKWLTDI